MNIERFIELFGEYTKNNSKREKMNKHIWFQEDGIYSDFERENIPKIVVRKNAFFVATGYDDMRGPAGRSFDDMEAAMKHFVHMLESYLDRFE